MIKAAVRYEGATMKGIDFIDRWIADSSRRLRAELAETALCHGEAIISCSTCSPATFERQWDHFSDLRSSGAVVKRNELIYIAGILAVGTAVMLGLCWSATWLFPGSASTMLSTICWVWAPILAATAAIWGAFALRYLISRSLGFADLFAAHNALASKAWATSGKAVYVSQCHPRTLLPRVRRIPFSHIADFFVEPSALGSRVTIVDTCGQMEHIYDPTGLDLEGLRSFQTSANKSDNSRRAGSLAPL